MCCRREQPYLVLTLFLSNHCVVHYHFMGSYTASGDGNESEGNLDNIRLAHEHDMGGK